VVFINSRGKKMKKFERYSRIMPWFTALLLSALAVGCGGGGGRDPILGADGIGALVAPAVTTVTPLNKATGVAINTRIVTAAFTRAMDAGTLTPATFTLACPAATPVTGTTVIYIAAGNVARLALPAATNLPSNTVCTATVTTGAKDTAGIALASNFAWTFTTGDAADATAPTLMSTLPANGATDVPVNREVIASFSEAMDPLTITDATFTLKRDGVTPVAGTLTLTVTTATFAPSSPLAVNATYTAEISSGKDLAGNVLTAAPALNPWTFKTASAPAAQGPALVDLDCAAGFAILAGSTVTNTGPTIISGGDLGLSPGSAVTGFPPGTISGGVIRINDVVANNAKTCLTTAYNDAAGRTTAPITVSGNIGGQTLAPGLYKSTSTLAISSGDLTLAGPADAVWIFQIASTLTTTAGRQIILSGGAQAKNIFWQVGTSATLGTTSVFQGNILADQSITLETGAMLNGRALTRIAAVSLDSNKVTKP
jgi:hypothetical protein